MPGGKAMQETLGQRIVRSKELATSHNIARPLDEV